MTYPTSGGEHLQLRGIQFCSASGLVRPCCRCGCTSAALPAASPAPHVHAVACGACLSCSWVLPLAVGCPEHHSQKCMATSMLPEDSKTGIIACGCRSYTGQLKRTVSNMREWATKHFGLAFPLDASGLGAERGLRCLHFRDKPISRYSWSSLVESAFSEASSGGSYRPLLVDPKVLGPSFTASLLGSRNIFQWTGEPECCW